MIKLTTGSIVELHRRVNDSVDLLVNGSLVARGEVVVEVTMECAFSKSRADQIA